jgi:hypothetical protein
MVVGYRPGRLAITRGEVVTVYTVTSPHDRGGRLVGYRLAKGNGECWDIDADLWQCCCPDYLYRAARRVQDGQPAACKHVRALKAALAKCPILI